MSSCLLWSLSSPAQAKTEGGGRGRRGGGGEGGRRGGGREGGGGEEGRGMQFMLSQNVYNLVSWTIQLLLGCRQWNCFYTIGHNLHCLTDGAWLCLGGRVVNIITAIFLWGPSLQFDVDNRPRKS